MKDSFDKQFSKIKLKPATLLRDNIYYATLLHLTKSNKNQVKIIISIRKYLTTQWPILPIEAIETIIMILFFFRKICNFFAAIQNMKNMHTNHVLTTLLLLLLHVYQVENESYSV